MTPHEALIVDAVRAGVLLVPAQNAMQFKTLRGMPGALLEQLRLHKDELLALLRSPATENSDIKPETGVPATYSKADTDAASGLPPYRVGDAPLAAMTTREAALNMVILAYALLVAVRQWRDLAGPDVRPNADVLECVRRDINAAIAVLSDPPEMTHEATRLTTAQHQLRIGE